LFEKINFALLQARQAAGRRGSSRWGSIFELCPAYGYSELAIGLP
jgi:hypothetical protein